MIRNSTKELLSPFENPEQKFRSKRRLLDTPSLVESNSPKLDHNFDIEEQSEEEGQFLMELRDNTFSGSEHEDVNEHIEKGVIPSKTAADAKIAIQEIVDPTQQSRMRNKKVNKKVYAGQVGCEICKGPHYTKDCPQKEEGKTLEEAYYTQFGAPYQPGGQYRAAGPGFYQQNNGNSSYPDRRPSLEESLTKFMAESAKRHEENSKHNQRDPSFYRCSNKKSRSFN
ncbi:ribonuclease H-like domain, reverse transcriptase, RNA-dependent DNA polymerase [Tanacetum coccineum]